MKNISLLLCFLFIVFSGCTVNQANIHHLKEEGVCPDQYTFESTYTQAWQSTIRALAEEEIIKTMNQDAGVVVTEYGVLEDQKINTVNNILGTSPYKYSFTITLLETEPDKTAIKVKTNLKISQMAIEREEDFPLLENYLRKKLFIRICKQLEPDHSQDCDSLFSVASRSLVEAELDTPEITLEPTPEPAAPPPPEKKPVPIILEVQQTLTACGYNPGPIDGLMGRRTKKAIKQFQADTNILETGYPDLNTLIALGLRQGKVKYCKPEEELASPQMPDNANEVQLASDSELIPSKNPRSTVMDTPGAADSMSLLSETNSKKDITHAAKTITHDNADRDQKLVTPYSSGSSAKRTALVIGNANYESSPLKNPTNDAADMTRNLRQCGFDVIQKIDADQIAMEKAVDRFYAKLKRSEVGLFYYAGHSVQVNGDNYLIPVDAHITSESDVKFESLNAGRIMGKMEDAGNRLNILILDACRDNPFKRSFRTYEQGLAQMSAPKGAIIVYATAPGAVAADGNGRNGIYTKYFLENMMKPDLPIEILLKETRIMVEQETNGKQVPWEHSSLMGNFYFVQGASAAGSKPSVIKP